MYPDAGRSVFGRKTLVYLERDMARYLSRKGILPILIPDLSGDEMEGFLAELDGFVFQGGADIAPESYGESPIANGRWPGDPYRDAYELKLMEYAIRNDKPVLGICRGFQLMNVYFGGSLFQDLIMEREGSIIHRDGAVYDQMNHGIRLQEGSLLARLHQDDPVRRVNTVHHQGLKRTGDQLEELAWCEADGLVEAFHWKGAPAGKVLGVQWHPEFFYNSESPLMEAHFIYDHFLSFCKP
jgi:putative glutamine amidotransferase